MENTPEERRDIAKRVNGKFIIYDEEELLEQMHEYYKQEMLSRVPDGASPEQAERLANVYADMALNHFRYDLPAIVYLVGRYLME